METFFFGLFYFSLILKMHLFQVVRKKRVKGLEQVFYMFHNRDLKQSLHS
jgi:hypothetical protein